MITMDSFTGREVGPLVTAALSVLLVAAAPGAALAQDAEVEETTVTLSTSRATLTLDMERGADRTIEFRDGVLSVDGEVIGQYESGGELERSWREFLGSQAAFEAESVRDALREFAAGAASSSGSDQVTAEALMASVHELLGDGAAGAAETVDAAAEGAAADIVRETRERLTIAPGGLSVESLTRQLERLDRSLAGLGDDVPHSDQLALVVHDDYQIAANLIVPGNVALLDGTLQLLGTIEGDVLVLDGDLIIEPSGLVDGNVLQVGGDVERLGGRISGELRSLMRRGPGVAARSAPRVDVDVGVTPEVWTPAVAQRRGFFGSVWHNIGHSLEWLFVTLTFWLGFGVLGALAVYFQRERLEVIADTARQNIARSFAVGVTGQFLFFPILIILAVAIITWLVIPLYLLGVALALIVGYLAVAHATGEALADLRYEGLAWLRRSNSYYYVLSGVAALLGLFAIAALLHLFGGLLGFLRGLAVFSGVALTWFAVSTGFGAVILSRAGTRRDYVWRTRTGRFDADADYSRGESASA